MVELFVKLLDKQMTCQYWDGSKVIYINRRPEPPQVRAARSNKGVELH